VQNQDIKIVGFFGGRAVGAKLWEKSFLHVTVLRVRLNKNIKIPCTRRVQIYVEVS
jgi:hypothetical protein